MKFQWYVVDLDEGTVAGSNDVDDVDQFIENDQYIVLTAQHGCFFNGSRDQIEVEELGTDEDEEDEDEEDEEDEDSDGSDDSEED